MYYHGMFDTMEIVVTDKVMYKKSIKGNSDLERSILPFLNDQDMLCPAASYRSQMYNRGEIVVLKVYNQDEIKVGLILCILIREYSVFFFVKQCIAKRD